MITFYYLEKPNRHFDRERWKDTFLRTSTKPYWKTFYKKDLVMSLGFFSQGMLLSTNQLKAFFPKDKPWNIFNGQGSIIKIVVVFFTDVGFYFTNTKGWQFRFDKIEAMNQNFLFANLFAALSSTSFLQLFFITTVQVCFVRQIPKKSRVLPSVNSLL